LVCLMFVACFSYFSESASAALPSVLIFLYQLAWGAAYVLTFIQLTGASTGTAAQIFFLHEELSRSPGSKE
jgi:hypothetical protein